MSLSLDGKKSLSIKLNDKKPSNGNETEIKIALLGTANAHDKKSLYF